MKRAPLFWDYPHYGNQGGMPGSAVRDGQWKLIEWHDEQTVELYDLDADPSEGENLVERRGDVAVGLRETLAKWRREVGAKTPAPNPRFRSKESPTVVPTGQ
jgi:arylsulfatase A-like enzyme